MKPPAEYWKNWFDEQASHAQSDYALNRGTTLRLDELESRSARNFLEAVDPQPEDFVLDAGCGSGRNISVLSPRVKGVMGIDYAEHMVQKARERVAAEKLTNVKLMPGDLTALQFPSDSFDKVVCASVLQYLDRAGCERALEEMIRVCKPGGRLVLHVKNGTSLYGVSLKCARTAARLLGRPAKPEFYRGRGWHERVLRRLGGRVLQYDGFGFLTFVPLPQKVVGWLLRCEMRWLTAKRLRRFAVNYQLTVLVEKVPRNEEVSALKA